MTIYEHDGKELFKDEDDIYEIEDVRSHYAEFDKRLKTATYTVIPAKGKQPRKVIFAKKTGTKGGIQPGNKTVVDALLSISPADLPAQHLLAKLLVADQEVWRRNEIEIKVVIEAAETIAQKSAEVVERCLALQPVPAPDPPLGF